MFQKRRRGFRGGVFVLTLGTLLRSCGCDRGKACVRGAGVRSSSRVTRANGTKRMILGVKGHLAWARAGAQRRPRGREAGAQVVVRGQAVEDLGVRVHLDPRLTQPAPVVEHHAHQPGEEPEHRRHDHHHADALEQAKAWFSYFPDRWRDQPPAYQPVPPARELAADLVPDEERQAYDMHDVIDALVDEESFFEIKPLFAPEMVCGLGLVDGKPVGFVANNPVVKGGVLFADTADKAARFVWCCDAFNIPLVFLADVPGFMIGTQVERGGIIRHGAKMVTAISEATVPKLCVVLRKAYGAGLYAMAGPAFEPEATIALPTAKIAVMGPEAAVNAVFANKIAAIEDPVEAEAFVAEQRRIYEEDVDILRLASEMVIDAVIEPEVLRAEIIRRFAQAEGKDRHFSDRRHGVPGGAGPDSRHVHRQAAVRDRRPAFCPRFRRPGRPSIRRPPAQVEFRSAWCRKARRDAGRTGSRRQGG